jgi:tight adherence protein C
MPLYLLIALIFVGIASLTASLLFLLAPKKSPLKERLERLEPEVSQYDLRDSLTLGQKFLGRLGAGIPLRIQDYGKYMRMLIAAGIRKERLPLFMGVKIALTVLLPAVYLIFYGMPIEEDIRMRVMVTAMLAIVGFLLPSFWLTRRVKNRQEQIFIDLPDVLDLMTVCVEAGLSVDSAMVTISQEANLQKSPLVREMRVVLAETRAGKPRVEALRDMGERSMVDDLKAFAMMLIQTERLGTSLAQALRVYSDSFRTIRMQRAQERAAKTTVKLVFPLVFFILPALFVVMLLPALIRLQRVMSSI